MPGATGAFYVYDLILGMKMPADGMVGIPVRPSSERFTGSYLDYFQVWFHAVPPGPRQSSRHRWPAFPDGHAASPDFDGPEVASFGTEDTHAVTVIGKMLVGFFFYSFLVMLAVALWTMSRGGQVVPNAIHSAQAEEAED